MITDTTDNNHGEGYSMTVGAPLLGARAKLIELIAARAPSSQHRKLSAAIRLICCPRVKQ
jgi:hypothetical protein